MSTSKSTRSRRRRPSSLHSTAISTRSRKSSAPARTTSGSRPRSASGQSALQGRATVLRSQAYYCDVTPPGIDKGRLVDLLAERLAVPRDEIAVLGDMGNDVEMFAAPASRSRWATPPPKSRHGAGDHLVQRRRRLRRGDRPLHPRLKRGRQSGRPRHRHATLFRCLALLPDAVAVIARGGRRARQRIRPDPG